MHQSTVASINHCINQPLHQSTTLQQSTHCNNQPLHCINHRIDRVIAENLDWVEFLVVVFLYKTNPNPQKKNYLLWEKVAQMPLFNLIFLGLGWPWVGEFVGFITTFIRFPTQQNSVNRKHPIRPMPMGTRCCKVFLPNFSKNIWLNIRSYRRYGKNGEKKNFSSTLFVYAAARGGTCTFTLKIASTLIKTAHVAIDLRSRQRVNPRPTRFVSGNAN